MIVAVETASVSHAAVESAPPAKDELETSSLSFGLPLSSLYSAKYRSSPVVNLNPIAISDMVLVDAGVALSSTARRYADDLLYVLDPSVS